MNLNVAILGASGIGKFHAREFKMAGCNVIAILGSSKKSSDKSSKELFESFGITAKPYYELKKLLENEELSIVSICTPPELHEEQMLECLKHNLNILCEKPFILRSDNKNYEASKQLIKLAKEKHKILTVNTQWPSALEYFGKYVNLNDVKNLAVYMESGKKGFDMLNDLLPHANSMLIKLVQNDKVKNITFSSKTEDMINIDFNYGTCCVKYTFKFNEGRPKNVVFCINDKKFVREVDKSYCQRFRSGNDIFAIEDSLKVSIRRFVESVKGNEKPLISESELLKNLKLQDLIINEHQKHNKLM